MSWGGFLDNLLNKLPIQNRVERWKNELEALQKERFRLLKGEANDKTIKRMEYIDSNISRLNGLLKNKATD